MTRLRLTNWLAAMAMFLICCGVLVAAERNLPATRPDGGAATLMLTKGDRVVIIGDSITEQKTYSRFIEDYLTMCSPQLDLWVFQLGWGGETAGGFLGRLDSDLAPLKPTVITTCYGMNDGGYRAFDPNIAKSYHDNMTRLIQKAVALGAVAVVGSPGAVDSTTFHKDAKAAEVYNATLARLGDEARMVAFEQHQIFANVHDPMFKTMASAKAALGQDVPVCGNDGVHPGVNGSLTMAYALLKAMGFDGNLGTITLDMAAGTAQATDGHKVLSDKDGTVELESTRYPFCFPADQKSADGLRNILAHVSFNQDLNRLMLVVKNLQAEKAKVTWGKQTRSYSKNELSQGINLAAEFLDSPFAEAWTAVDAAVAAKQNYETGLIKGHNRSLAGVAALFPTDAEAVAAVKVLQGKLMGRHQALCEAVRKAQVAVKHTLVVVAGE